MSVDQISDLYHELAFGRTKAAIEALDRVDYERLIAEGAHALEQAAAALACVTAAYTTPEGELADRWETQIAELIRIAASLEQAADACRLPER